MKVRSAWIALAALPLAAQAAAQTVTRIDPDVDPARSLGTSVSSAGPAHVIDGGTRAGANLFHSFARFDLAFGDTASWIHGAGDPAGILNVVNRVTGGAPSSIFGTLDSSAIPNADFWFINPAGILIGEGARLNVPAAAHFSTGEELIFEDGTTFAVATPGGSTFSVASPFAFGFLGDQQAIELADVGREFLPDGGRLSLNASDISVRGSDLAGRGYQLIAVGAARTQVPLLAPMPSMLGGSVTVESSVLRLIGDEFDIAGIDIGGGLVRISRSDVGTAFVAGPDSGVGGPIDIFGEEIDIFSSLVSASTFGPDRAGDIRITGGSLLVHGGSIVATNTLAGSTGDPGSLEITARDVRIADRSFVTTATQTAKPAGDLAITGDRIALTGFAVVESQSMAEATGPGATIRIRGGDLDLSDASTITSDTWGAGDAGTILVDMSGRVALREGSAIKSATNPGSSGQAGRVSIRAADLQLLNRALVSTATFGSGDAGLIEIEAVTLLLDGFSIIQTRSFGDATGDAGRIVIGPGSRLVMGARSTIQSGNDGAGDGGNISIDMDEIELREHSRISSDALPGCFEETCGPAGSAGNIEIRADQLTLLGIPETFDRTSISSDARGGADAGSILLEVGSLRMSGPAIVSSATFGAGRGGAIVVNARTIDMQADSRFSTNTEGTGPGGRIEIAADTFAMGGASRLTSVSDHPDGGDGGAIIIRSRDILVEDSGQITTFTFGSGNAGSIDIAGERLRIDGGIVVTDTIGAGKGGAIRLAADEMVISGSLVAAESLDPCNFFNCVRAGDAGSVTIEAASLRVTTDIGGIASLVSSSTATEGRGGDVNLTAAEFVLDGGSRIESKTIAAGDAGRIAIASDTIRIDDGLITTGSAAGSTGRSGTISVASRDMAIGNGGSVETISRNSTSAGNIVIDTDTLVVAGPGSRVSSANEAAAGGDAGTATIAARLLTLGEGGEISTSSVAGAAGDISILMPTDGILRLTGIDAPGTITTSSGPGTGGRIIIASPYAIISDGGSILALGEQGGANVQIQTDFFISSADRPNLVAVDGSFLLEAQVGDMSRGTVERDLSVLDASGVLRGQCATVRETGQVSQLVVRPVGPLGTRGEGIAPPLLGTCL